MRWLLTVAVYVLAGCGAATPLPRTPPPPARPAVERGMGREQVVQALGQPAQTVPAGPGEQVETWYYADGTVVLLTDARVSYFYDGGGAGGPVAVPPMPALQPAP